MIGHPAIQAAILIVTVWALVRIWEYGPLLMLAPAR